MYQNFILRESFDPFLHISMIVCVFFFNECVLKLLLSYVQAMVEDLCLYNSFTHERAVCWVEAYQENTQCMDKKMLKWSFFFGLFVFVEFFFLKSALSMMIVFLFWSNITQYRILFHESKRCVTSIAVSLLIEIHLWDNIILYLFMSICILLSGEFCVL